MICKFYASVSRKTSWNYKQRCEITKNIVKIQAPAEACYRLRLTAKWCKWHSISQITPQQSSQIIATCYKCRYR